MEISRGRREEEVMIYITGDTHGDMSRIVRFCERMESSKEDIIIIPGEEYDFDVYFIYTKTAYRIRDGTC